MPKQINFCDELVIDNFAGGGGASTGIEFAIGRPVDIAINHDSGAIAMHKANHPYTKHYCESVWDVDPIKAAKGRPIALAWFSPDCKHFSKAKGGKPVEKHIRGLAWVAVRWAAKVKPRVIILENVEEFKTWGPVIDGRPDKKQSGRTFNSFVNALKKLGYVVDWKALKACDYGAPTIRKRFFLVARCDGRPIVWPEPTHGPGKLPYRTAADIIDWSLPCPSIFDTSEQIKAAYGIKAVRPLAPNTLHRIAKGIQKFVIDNPDPFIIQVNHTGEAFRGQGINEPLQTITAKHGYGVVTPYIMLNNGNNVPSGMSEPVRTVTTGNRNYLVTPVITSIGQTGFTDDRSRAVQSPLNTVVSKAEQCLIAPALIQYHSETAGSEVRGQSIESPVMTIDSSPRYAMIVAFMSKYYSGGYSGAGNYPTDPLNTITSLDHNAVVTSHLCVLRNNQDGKSMTEPMPTIMTSPGHFAEVRSFLIKYYGQGVGQKIDTSLDTIVSRDRFGLVTVHGTEYAIVDIGLRMLTPRELYNAQGFPEDYIIDLDFEGKKYPKSKQVARCGNAVPPAFSEALVRANLPELCGKKFSTMDDLEKEIAI